MPLTPLQSEIVKILADNRNEESHLAGGAALHFQPNSIRYSEDLDYFHDTQNAVEKSFLLDQATLQKHGYICDLEVQLQGYIRAIIKKSSNQSTKIEWAHDSAWRFMPIQKDTTLGYVLHPVDLWVNKFLALVGRDEPRDFLDIIYIDKNHLSLGALCWAACGKDPGYNPHMLIDLLKRKGRYQESDFLKLHLKNKINLHTLKTDWILSLQQAETFVDSCPADFIGCLFYSVVEKKFVTPDFKVNKKLDQNILPHYCKHGGVVPQIANENL